MVSTLEDRARVRYGQITDEQDTPRQARRRGFDSPPIFFTWCEGCAHRSYSTRRDARRVRRHHRSRHGLSVFRCPFDSRRWHLGHRPEDLSHGAIDRPGLAESKRARAGAQSVCETGTSPRRQAAVSSSSYAAHHASPETPSGRPR